MPKPSAKQAVTRTITSGATRVPWWRGLRWCRLRNGTVAWPRPMEHEAQPHQGYQHQLVKKEMGDHGKTPSSRWRNEGIVETIASLPGFGMAPEGHLSYS